MWQNYINAFRIEDVLQILSDKQNSARVIAGGTDLILEMERGVRKGINTLIDISRIPGLAKIVLDEDSIIHIGPAVTHNDCISSALLREQAFPLVNACWEVGSPQIRNRGTVAGNLITASPANDTIPALIALDAVVTLMSKRGKRNIRLEDFYLGVRKTVMQPDEMLVDISFHGMEKHHKGVFQKNALRRAQAISVVNTAILLKFEGDNSKKIQSARLAYGSVSPTIVRGLDAETYLVGKELTPETIIEAARLAKSSVNPISDIRSSLEYRQKMVDVYTRRALETISRGTETEIVPENPVLLRTPGEIKFITPEDGRDSFDPKASIDVIINGKQYHFPNGRQKTLLHLLREDAHLQGSKEGCGEGECGACTIYLDGAAVMGCLVPAGRADGAEITTIEGLSQGEQLHPVQQSFIDEGAVQCGYCTPGFIMSAAKLLEEYPNPTTDQIKQAITGNLCRCTGYYTIVKAIEGSIQAPTKG